MSSLSQLKRDIRLKRQQHGGNFNVYRDLYTPDKDRVVVLPTKPKNKEKLMDVEKEAKRTLARNSKSRGGSGGRIMRGAETPMDVVKNHRNENDDSDEEEEEKKEKKKKIKKIPWGPKEIMEHLDNPEIVLDLDGVIIPSFKKTDDDDEYDEKGEKKKKEKEVIVWDHGETKEGKQSDNNFLLWLEAYASFRCKEKKEEENKAFD